MISDVLNYFINVRDRQRVSIALSRGAAMMPARKIDLTNPATWEFSGFSQNGEDGILDVLRSQLKESNRYFIEIGVEDGIECNTAWLVVAEKYSGIMIDGNAKLAKRANDFVFRYNIGAECHHLFMKKDNVERLKSLALHSDPDVFSLDVDGNDFYLAQAILNSGFRPKIVAVEYNSAYGPHRSMTIEYDEEFVMAKAHPSQLYYGVSIAGWRTFFAKNGYRFVTVERRGVNAFFVDPTSFKPGFLSKIRGLKFAENQYQLMKFRKPSEEQFALIASQRFVTI